MAGRSGACIWPSSASSACSLSSRPRVTGELSLESGDACPRTSLDSRTAANRSDCVDLGSESRSDRSDGDDGLSGLLSLGDLFSRRLAERGEPLAVAAGDWVRIRSVTSDSSGCLHAKIEDEDVKNQVHDSETLAYAHATPITLPRLK